jgi:hypothetical protein
VKLGTYSVYGLVLLSCRDFRQALEQTLRYEQLAHDLGRSDLVESVFAGIRVFGAWLAGRRRV